MSDDRTGEQRLTAFTDWLRNSHGYDITQQHIRIDTDSAERGIVATQPISVTCAADLSTLNTLLNNNNTGRNNDSKLKPVVSIPQSLLLTPPLIRETIIQPLLNTAQLHSRTVEHRYRLHTDYQLLCICLIYHCRLGGVSLYEPYISTLPQSYTRIEWLSASHIDQLAHIGNIDAAVYHRSAQHAIDEVLSDWALTVKFVQQCTGVTDEPASYRVTSLPLNYTHTNAVDTAFNRKHTVNNVWLAPISLAEYQWAHATVATRSCYLPPSKVHSTGQYILVPFLDMLNHTDSVSTQPHYNTGTQFYELYLYGNAETQFISNTQQLQYDTGQELHISYGAHDNLLLIERYGFSLADNMHDYVRLTVKQLHAMITGIDASIAAPHSDDAQTRDVLMQCGLTGVLDDETFVFKLYRISNHTDLAWDLLTYIRLLAVQHTTDSRQGKVSSTSRIAYQLLNDQPVGTTADALVCRLVVLMCRQLMVRLVSGSQPCSDYVDGMIETYRVSQISILQSIVDVYQLSCISAVWMRVLLL